MSIQSYEMTLIDYLKVELFHKLSTARSAILFDDTLDNVVKVDDYLEAFGIETIYSYTTPAEKQEDVKGYELCVIPFLEETVEESVYAEYEEVKFAVCVVTTDYDTLGEQVNVDYVKMYPFLTFEELSDAVDVARVTLKKVMKDAGIQVKD